MAIFYPPIEQIMKLKVPPTDGEMTLLNFLDESLDDSYQVYFNPYLNGDRPDVLIMREGNGVIVIEVKDWNLRNYSLNEKKKWVLKLNDSVVKSPIDQVLKYKNNLFDLHVDKLLEKKINDIRYFNIVSCAVYFHCASQSVIENLLVNPYKKDEEYQKFLNYNIELIGSDSLEEHCFTNILHKHFMLPSQRSYLFTIDIYQNFKRILSPAIHFKSQGEPHHYSEKQRRIIYSDILEQRVRGVFGSGKTTVLAERAVQAYKRALKRTKNPRILILTFNITLKNFIHDKLMRVDEEFHIENFVIINYHSFITAEFNNLNIDIEIPKDYPEERISEYLEYNYYSNISLFDEHKDEIQKYDAVLIDEVQDYHRQWMEIIKLYFRDPLGDYVLFGDVKQNIYGLPIVEKDVITNVKGVTEFKYCYRSDLKIIDLVHVFQSQIFGNKYDIDDFSDNNMNGILALTTEKEGYYNYMYLPEVGSLDALYNIIRGNILNKANNISPNDITILGYTTNQLRLFDCYYRYRSRERTNTMFETIEVMYMTHLNYLSNNSKEKESPSWFKYISEHIAKKLFPNSMNLYEWMVIRIKQHIAKLFTIYDLYVSHPETFYQRLKEECNVCKIKIDEFLIYRKHYENDLSEFKTMVFNTNYKNIRDNKKLHFWMNSGTIKISTINSFKGWESEVVFLIIEPKYESDNTFNISFNELLYTGITRSRKKLIIINFGNVEYNGKIRPLIEAIK